MTQLHCMILHNTVSYEVAEPQNTPDPPTISLKEALRVTLPQASQWETIGTLLGFPEETLKKIKEDHPNQLASCLREMLQHWLKQTNPPPSWKDLSMAIELVKASN